MCTQFKFIPNCSVFLHICTLHKRLVKGLFSIEATSVILVEAAYSSYMDALSEKSAIKPLALHVFGEVIPKVFGEENVRKKRKGGDRKCKCY